MTKTNKIMSGSFFQKQISGAFSGMTFLSTDFREAVFEKAIFTGCVFEKSKFSGAKFRHAVFTDCSFFECDFVHGLEKPIDPIMLEDIGMKLYNCRFYKCDFLGCEMEHVCIQETVFNECRFSKKLIGRIKGDMNRMVPDFVRTDDSIIPVFSYSEFENDTMNFQRPYPGSFCELAERPLGKQQKNYSTKAECFDLQRILEIQKKKMKRPVVLLLTGDGDITDIFKGALYKTMTKENIIVYSSEEDTEFYSDIAKNERITIKSSLEEALEYTYKLAEERLQIISDKDIPYYEYLRHFALIEEGLEPMTLFIQISQLNLKQLSLISRAISLAVMAGITICLFLDNNTRIEVGYDAWSTFLKTVDLIVSTFFYDGDDARNLTGSVGPSLLNIDEVMVFEPGSDKALICASYEKATNDNPKKPNLSEDELKLLADFFVADYRRIMNEILKKHGISTNLKEKQIILPPSALLAQEKENSKARILIIGAGETGIRFVDGLSSSSKNRFFVCKISSDTGADNKKLSAAEANGKADNKNRLINNRVEEIFQNAVTEDLEGVILACGLGGEMESELIPMIAEAVKGKGILTCVIVTEPFKFENRMRLQRAKKGIETLIKNTDVVLSVKLQDLLSIVDRKVSVKDAFKKVETIVADIIEAIAQIICDRNTLPEDRESVIVEELMNRNLISEGGKKTEGYISLSISS